MKNKKILITGADGFIGSHLTEYMVGKCDRIRALAQYNSFNDWGWLENIDRKDEIEIVSGDIRDPFFCEKITKDIDIVFHLAALIAIPYSYIAPHSYVSTNINGTMNICNAAMKNNCEKIIHTSTSEVYGTALYVPIDEKHPLQPQSPYSASKIGADAIAMSFFNSYNLPLAIARPFNTYGPRQSGRAVIPSIIIQILSGIKKIKLGDVSPTRDFNYVTDTCQGFHLIAKNSEFIGEVTNIGSGQEISVKDTLELIKKLCNSDVEYLTDNSRIRPEKSEVFRLLCDNQKIKRMSDFSTKVCLEEGLKKTIDWFSVSENLRKYKNGVYNV